MKCINCGSELNEKRKEKIVVGYSCDVCKKYHPYYQGALDCEKFHIDRGSKLEDGKTN